MKLKVKLGWFDEAEEDEYDEEEIIEQEEEGGYDD